MDDVVVDALAELARGRHDAALAVLTSGRGRGGRLRRELADHLTARHGGEVYQEPAGFRLFADSGGNVELYRATADRLAAAYRELAAHRVLDIGCGDGRAVLAAAAALGSATVPEFDLVEPSAAQLERAVAGAAAAGLAVRAHHGTAQDLLAEPPGQTWDLVESTFAMHALPPAERTRVLAALRHRAAAVLVVEFDVPAFADGGPAHLDYLADRYEHGVAEFDNRVIAQGFLMPVLVGQLDPGAVRHTWEQPAAAWAAQLAEAGWADVTVEPLSDYWWAPAVTVTARAVPAPPGSGLGSAEPASSPAG